MAKTALRDRGRISKADREKLFALASKGKNAEQIGDALGFTEQYIEARLAEGKNYVPGSNKNGSGSSRGRKGSGTTVSRSWYSDAALTALYKKYPGIFSELPNRLANIEEIVAQQEAEEAIAEQYDRLKPLIKDGLLSEADAEKSVKRWAKDNGYV